MIEAIPALTEVVQDTCSSSESDSEDIDGHGRDMFTKKQTLNPAHGRSVDKRSDDMVSALCKEQVVDRNGTHHIPTPGVDEVSVPANHTTHNPDANANTIRNVLCNDENSTPRKEDDVGSRYVPFDPVSDTCAPSAHSETSTRKNAFQRSLGNGAQHRQPLMITDEPTFSLGLTQEEQIQPDAHVMATEVGRGEPMSDNNGDDNIEEGQGSRKSKRVPSGLLDDY
ncbi:unnamed protein product [Brassica napus]|uniref:(rape) hypothetical protein n=1 Tax=Brassica napus TaxID=3708 RepID=A0A816RUV5_BRANA|nr:unnamed protein product [Brassica napus]